MKAKWKAINRVGKIGSQSHLKGCWLIDPNGERVCTIMDHATALQIAAAMNLTTAKQRHDYCAEESGYRLDAKERA